MKGEICKDELDKLAKVEFSWSDIQELVELANTYAGRFSGEVPDFMLEHAPITRQSPRLTELDARRAFVEAVEGVWRQRYGRPGRGAFASKGKKFDGPLLRLFEALFVAMGEKPPSCSTLYDDIMFVATRRERQR